MIDLHCHILPGIDDGAVDWDEAVAICQRAAADGCTAMVATPHLRHRRWWNDDRKHLEGLLEELQHRVGDTLDLHLGGEVALSMASFQEMLRGPEGATAIPPLAGSKYLLVEFDWQGPNPTRPDEVVHELQLVGWQPIIAHPERFHWLMDDLGLVHALMDAGALSQLTAGSLTGRLGHNARVAAGDLLDMGWAHFVASDAHNLETRPPGLTAARSIVAHAWGEDVAEELFVTNPAAVVAHESIAAAAGTAHVP